ncbi:sensor histidine kinase [Ornithinimicrobium murale]|uniref:sensor histidine kinase n=1 Tax=Ornithinimicrobium murale TaxID=1050153 RepID=UPI000E0D75A8|nr:histidine kinase [Ornithinimicrobium murale]
MSTMSPDAEPISRPFVLGTGTARLRPVGRAARFGLMVLVCLTGSLLALGAALSRWAEDSPTGEVTGIRNLLVLAALVGAIVVVVALRRRHTAPYAVTLLSASLPLLLPLDATAALFALAALVRARSGRLVWACVALVGLATAVALVRDASGRTTDSSLLKSMTTTHPAGQAVPADLSMWVPLIVAMALLGAAVGAGMFMRNRVALAVTQGRADAAQQSSEVLSDRLGRQAERDLIAREVHDVIGHRLSLLSLHAGGLQVAAGQDPRLAHSAALIRESAQQAMNDLQSLLRVLREPEETALNHTTTPSLSDLPTVIDETVDGGMPVISTVYLSEAEAADPALARAVYRIVQELLTNARRHAPGAPVRLVVQGGPEVGVRIETANHLTTQHPGPVGNGLTGVSERVGLLGGTVRHGLDDEQIFRVAVQLPWIPAPQAERQEVRQ